MTANQKGLAALTIFCLMMATIRAGEIKFEPALLYCVLALVFTLIFANSELE